MFFHDNFTAIASYHPSHVMKGDDEKLMNLSAASADRLLRHAREAMRMKGRSGTRSPGSSLNTMIPIRAYYTLWMSAAKRDSSR